MTSTPAHHTPKPGVTISSVSAVFPLDCKTPVSISYETSLATDGCGMDPLTVPPFFIDVAQRLSQQLNLFSRVEVNVDHSPGTSSVLLPPFRFRDKSFSAALQPRTWTAPGSRSGLIAAMAAREAAIEGRDRAVDDFAVDWLGIRPAKAGQWREAVSTALLTDWTAALSTPSMAEESVLRLLKTETLMEHRRLQPVWTRRSGGCRTHLLDK
ncbi:hypothetical protein [Streptomyces iranensis]|uniref:Uncharacterized protein n=1 Tax=Streptomyces iranensis TaxID=576784 RepID=A0A060ZW39_9ACTN|nr:hypothetical protein [Streptomyces iranensis]MBP2059550.1 hypothetical protein [Streptomyces iranensis]CDR10597.1 predicted protein [Streptomyces iranensis]